MRVEQHICRLCFDVTNADFNEIGDIMGDALEVLLLEMDLNITESPMICETCTRIIKGLLYFKLVCLHSEKLILSFSIREKEAKFELMDVVHKNRDTEMAVEENFRCRFCMNGIKNNDFATIDILMQETLYKNMLPVFMPEMNFSIVRNPIVCTSCKENLDCYFKLIKDCLNVENQIHKFCQDVGNNKSRIKDSNVLFFQCSSSRFKAGKCTWTQSNTRDSTTSEYSCELTKIEEILDIKDDGELLNEDSSERPSLNGDRYTYKRNYNLLQTNICSESDTNSYNIFTRKTKQTQSQERNQLDKVNHKCTLCAYMGKCKCSVQEHMLNYKDPTEVDMYKCLHCLYRTKREGGLKQHMLLHTDTSEVKTYKCDSCAYVTKYKGALQQHALTHKDVSEIETYKCSLCSYETNCKRYLKGHMLVHKDVSQVAMYKCGLCTYASKLKANLQRHALTHKDVSEVETYKCSRCLYETKCKSYLKSHMLVHKDVWEVEMYKCESCTYTARNKYTLQQHALSHKDASEVTMYKCSLCSYQTKWKSHLKRHIVRHKDASELEMYKCPLCDCQFKHKENMKRHILVHKNRSELECTTEMHKCTRCAFESKYAGCLKRHMLTHLQASSSEITTHKCPTCCFQTRHKRNIKQHMLTHKEGSELKLYKCTMCPFETKYKGNLTKHVLKHAYRSAQK